MRFNTTLFKKHIARWIKDIAIYIRLPLQLWIQSKFGPACSTWLCYSQRFSHFIVFFRYLLYTAKFLKFWAEPFIQSTNVDCYNIQTMRHFLLIQKKVLRSIKNKFPEIKVLVIIPHTAKDKSFNWSYLCVCVLMTFECVSLSFSSKQLLL